MNQRTWSLYAPIYERAMRSDRKVYAWMYRRISSLVKDKDVLECATGPGLLARHIAPSAKHVIATDYAEGMLICPNFVSHDNTLISRIWSGILRIAGIQFEHQWDEETYHKFLKENHWDILYSKLLPARISLAYVEAGKSKY